MNTDKLRAAAKRVFVIATLLISQVVSRKPHSVQTPTTMRFATSLFSQTRTAFGRTGGNLHLVVSSMSTR